MVDSAPTRGAEAGSAVGTRAAGPDALRAVGFPAVPPPAGLIRPPTNSGALALSATRLVVGDSVARRKDCTDLLTRSCCESKGTRAVPSRRAVTEALKGFCKARARSDPEATTIRPWLARYGTTGNGPRIAVACWTSPVRIARGVCRALLPRSRESTYDTPWKFRALR